MKFPFDFSISLVFRLVFPGVVIATATLPFFLGLFRWLKFSDISATLLLPILAVIIGWVVVLSDQPIYQFLEGRRYSPAWVRRWLVGRQARRLEKIEQRYQAQLGASDLAGAREIDLAKLDYPINTNGEFFAQMPTRLGNLLYAYETYPKTAYGIDAVFFWYRLWVGLDKDLRSALDEVQAVADSAVYVAFAMLAAFAIALLYAIGGFAAELFPLAASALARAPHWVLAIVHVFPALWPLKAFDLPYLPSPLATLGLGVIFLLLSVMFYNLSFPAQRAYGELFKSLFDQYRDKLSFADAVAQTAADLGGDAQEARDAKFLVATRYLRWHKIRPLGHDNITPEAWKKRTTTKPA